MIKNLCSQSQSFRLTSMCDVMYLDYLCFITKTEKLNTEDSARATHNQQKG